MIESIPHFLLMSEARATTSSGVADSSMAAGQWRFVLESADGQTQLEVDEEEFESDPERLDLIAVVRGLEALDQPSRVTLVTGSSYVQHGFRYGLEEWRQNDWQWERFGEMAPVKNSDLWRRIDRALRFHRVDCRAWRFDKTHAGGEATATARLPADLARFNVAATTTPPAPHFDRAPDRSPSTDGSSHERHERTRAARSPESRLEQALVADRGLATKRRRRVERVPAGNLAQPRLLIAKAGENAAAVAQRWWHSCRHWLADAFRHEES